jgi:stearoyl-CoA desaturase (delta-9 desaturase)
MAEINTAVVVARSDRPIRDFFGLESMPVVLMHIAAVAGVIYAGWSWSGFAVALLWYGIRMFFISAGFHRYFAHRTYKTSRAFQFFLALGGCTAAQKGPLWWAGSHRIHHRYSDQPGDLHSAKRDGMWWSHIGWILVDDHRPIPWNQIKDMSKYPELRLLDRFPNAPVWAYALTMLAVGGWHLVLWGFVVSTVLLWHGTLSINSLAHKIGRRRYPTTDNSKNSLLLALLSHGEGWHNNHHYYMNSCNQAFHWYQIDLSYYLLRFLSLFHIVWDIRVAPRKVIDAPRELLEPPSDVLPAAEVA